MLKKLGAVMLKIIYANYIAIAIITEQGTV